MKSIHPLFLTALLCPLACAGDLDDEFGGDAVEEPAEGEVGPNIHSEAQNAGQRTTVDASDEAAWVYFDLETGTQLQVDDPMTNFEWDLAFQRFNLVIKLSARAIQTEVLLS